MKLMKDLPLLRHLHGAVETVIRCVKGLDIVRNP